MIDKDTVQKIAFLSQLKIDDKNMEEVQKEFNGIVDWFSELSEVNTDEVEPLLSVNEQNLVCREDVVTVENNAEAILKNAPAAEYGYFVVPKVVE